MRCDPLPARCCSSSKNAKRYCQLLFGKFQPSFFHWINTKIVLHQKLNTRGFLESVEKYCWVVRRHQSPCLRPGRISRFAVGNFRHCEVETDNKLNNFQDWYVRCVARAQKKMKEGPGGANAHRPKKRFQKAEMQRM